MIARDTRIGPCDTVRAPRVMFTQTAPVLLLSLSVNVIRLNHPHENIRVVSHASVNV